MCRGPHLRWGTACDQQKLGDAGAAGHVQPEVRLPCVLLQGDEQ